MDKAGIDIGVADLRGTDTHRQLPRGQLKTRADQELHHLADENRQAIQRLLPQDRSTPGSEVVDVQGTPRRRLIQARSSRAEYNSRGVQQRRAYAAKPSAPGRASAFEGGSATIRNNSERL
jgi:hypothetical protein